MKKPMINERSGKFQITFWDESGGGRKQKTVGSGENALKMPSVCNKLFSTAYSPTKMSQARLNVKNF